MGHKNLSTTEIYIHAIEEEKGIAYNIINDTIGGRDFEGEFSTNYYKKCKTVHNLKIKMQ